MSHVCRLICSQEMPLHNKGCLWSDPSVLLSVIFGGCWPAETMTSSSLWEIHYVFFKTKIMSSVRHVCPHLWSWTRNKCVRPVSAGKTNKPWLTISLHSRSHPKSSERFLLFIIISRACFFFAVSSLLTRKLDWTEGLWLKYSEPLLTMKHAQNAAHLHESHSYADHHCLSVYSCLGRRTPPVHMFVWAPHFHQR